MGDGRTGLRALNRGDAGPLIDVRAGAEPSVDVGYPLNALAAGGDIKISVEDAARGTELEL